MIGFTWVLSILSIIATVANIYKKRWCFYIWALTNLSWVLVGIKTKVYAQSLMFFMYFLLAIWGIICWKLDSNC